MEREDFFDGIIDDSLHGERKDPLMDLLTDLDRFLMKEVRSLV